MTLKIENDNSNWKFWNLFNKTITKLKALAQDPYDKNIPYERVLIRFLERIPTGDYSNLRVYWNTRLGKLAIKEAIGL